MTRLVEFETTDSSIIPFMHYGTIHRSACVLDEPGYVFLLVKLGCIFRQELSYRDFLDRDAPGGSSVIGREPLSSFPMTKSS